MDGKNERAKERKTEKTTYTHIDSHIQIQYGVCVVMTFFDPIIAFGVRAAAADYYCCIRWAITHIHIFPQSDSFHFSSVSPLFLTRSF